MKEPTWANVKYGPIDYQSIRYFSAPKEKGTRSPGKIDPELLKTYDKLGIPLRERELLAGVAVDAVFDSVSVATTFKEKLGELGIIFCSFSEAVREHPELVPQIPRLGGSLYGQLLCHAQLRRVQRPVPSPTYPRACAARWSFPPTSASTPAKPAQFERTLIVADEGAYVSYLKAAPRPCGTRTSSTPPWSTGCFDNAQIKYSTVQNWYPATKNGKGGIYNFVTKRGKCQGVNSKISWTQVETGSASPEVPQLLSSRETTRLASFLLVAVTNNYQQADTGTKMISHRQEHQEHHCLEGHFRRPWAEQLPRHVKILGGATGARNYSSATRC